MNHTSFAALTRPLRRGRTRRAILGGLIGGLAALVGVGGGQAVVAARCSAAAPCPACHRCRKRRCQPLRDGSACDGGTCVGAVCAPPKTTAGWVGRDETS